MLSYAEVPDTRTIKVVNVIGVPLEHSQIHRRNEPRRTRLVREALGADAVVLSNRTLDDGSVEIVALADSDLPP